MSPALYGTILAKTEKWLICATYRSMASTLMSLPISLRWSFHQPSRSRIVRSKAGARFDGARFMQGLSFGSGPHATAGPHTTSPSTRFFQKVSFANTVFEGPANFADTVFNASVTFDGASFYDLATFRNANLYHSASFERCSFMGAVDFAGCAFAVKGHSTSRISFEESKFKTRPTFDHAVFRGSLSRPVDVSFANVSFAAGADFHFAQFGDASNSGAVRVVNVIFDGISCLGTLLFSHARFRSPFQALAGQRLGRELINSGGATMAYLAAYVRSHKRKFARPASGVARLCH